MPIHSLDLREPMLLKFNIRSEQGRGNYRLFSCLLETEDVCGGNGIKSQWGFGSFLGISDNRIHLSAVH